MTLDKIKNSIDKEKGKFVRVIYNGGRNKTEQYEGTLMNTYNYIFTIKLSDGTIKSFSYCDVLIKTVELYFNKNV